MEPVYPDGSFVYIDEQREPRIGDDVVVVYEGTLYIKTFTTAGLVYYNTKKMVLHVFLGKGAKKGLQKEHRRLLIVVATPTRRKSSYAPRKGYLN